MLDLCYERLQIVEFRQGSAGLMISSDMFLVLILKEKIGLQFLFKRGPQYDIKPVQYTPYNTTSR